MKKFVKTLVVLTSVLVLGLSAERASAQVNIVTDQTWQASQNMNGPWGPAFLVGACTNNCVLQCLCPNWNGNLNINTCANAQPIWGTPPPADCFYPAATFFFRQTFNLNYDPTDPCTTVNGTVLWQADNSSRIWINGQTAGNLTSPASGWNTPNGPINIAPYLVPGQNTIIVQVTNLGAGGCPNFAFLSLCLTANVVQQPVDASFGILPTPTTGGFNLSSTNVQNPNLYHEWYFMTGPGPNGPWTPVGYIPGSVNFSNYLAPNCVFLRIIHRVSTAPDSNCEECEDDVFYNCGGQFKAIPDEERAVIDCAELRDYEWPTTGFGGTDSGFGKVQVGQEPGAGVQLHPNPSKDLLNVTWDKLEVNALKVVDLNGKQLLEQRIDPETNALELDISSLPAGIYLLELSGAYEKVVKKFSVMK